MKVAIIGSNGQLGTDLVNILSATEEVTGLTHADIEITDPVNLREVFSAIKPDIVLNTAAYHVVPEAENYPDKAFLINGSAPLNLARITSSLGIRLMHFSTDYVFDGSKQQPYLETDCPNPLNVYATTKLAGEQFVLNYSDLSYVVRVSGIYGTVPSRAKGNNFVSMMLRLAAEKPEVRVVTDEVLAPTPTLHIAKAVARLIHTDAFGLYHLSAGGEVSWYEFARTIWDEMKLETPLHKASVNDFPMVVKRPFYSVLDNSKIRSAGIDSMPSWKEGLIEYLATLRA
ncbi:MAG: dTDP-4-dehydrorhamnose reductase [Chitinophagaceae bacterium]|nr:MAG: dTDP-4-dehydrorhamnose reductase [Chitinophagaceae bacterium]